MGGARDGILSGKRHRTGDAIWGKEHLGELRWAMVEVSRRAAQADPHWKRLFSQLERRMHRNQAFVVGSLHLCVG